MNPNYIMDIFSQTAYVRMGGSPEELKTAELICREVEDLGLKATIEPFEVYNIFFFPV